MGTVRFLVSGQLLRDYLHIPDGCSIVGAAMVSPFEEVEFVVVDPSLPLDGHYLATPTVTHKPETFEFDWGIHQDASEAVAPGERVRDLMAALEESLAKAKTGG